MPFIKYINKNLRRSSEEVIDLANDILDEYAAQGFDLTLRQLFYQFVARGYIPNTEQSYTRLGTIVSDGRLLGKINWDSILDRTRFLRGTPHLDDPAEALQNAANSYAIDKWADQEHRVEVWIEKDALVGIVQQACVPLDVNYFSCRGYVSQSAMWRAGQRLKYHYGHGQPVTVLHLGDHDPSGIDMTRDIEDRLSMFTGYNNFTVKRIALTMEQVEHYDPPPNPTKLTDSRAGDYIIEYGHESWELDAIPPNDLVDLIEVEVAGWRDDELWEAAVKREEQERQQIRDLAETL